MLIRFFLFQLLGLFGGNLFAQNIPKMEHLLFKEIPQSEYDLALLYYTDKAIQGATVEEVLENSKTNLLKSLAQLPTNKITYRYSVGKWTVGEVLQHIISYERIMTESALMIAGLVNPSEAQYQFYSQASTAKGGSNKTKSELTEAFLETRNATIAAFKKLNEQQLKSIGTLDGFKTSVRMLALCISGHQVHHFKVLKNQYQVL